MLEATYAHAREALKVLTGRRSALLAKNAGAKSPLAFDSPAVMKVDDEIRAVKATIAPLKMQRAAAVRAKLAAHCLEEARHALVALDAAQEAIISINVARAEIRKAGGIAPDISTRHLLVARLMLQATLKEPK
jgi:hypothetical protein